MPKIYIIVRENVYQPFIIILNKLFTSGEIQYFNNPKNCQKIKKFCVGKMEDEELKALRAKRMAEMQGQGVSFENYTSFLNYDARAFCNNAISQNG